MSNKNKLNQAIYFITGTDTDIGKTVCTKALLQAANKQHKATLGYKPISAGCEATIDGLRNEDALTLQQHSSIQLPYSMINPVAYQQPIAPHIAAAEIDQAIDINLIDKGLSQLKQHNPDLLLIEGAGGWHLPINNKQLLSTWVVEQKIPVIVIVGLKLGCLNHALLTIESIRHSGGVIAGWIANHSQQNMPYVNENIATLKSFITEPLLAEIPYMDNIDKQNLADLCDIEF